MSTVGQVVDRVYREWLTPASEQEGLVLMDGAVGAGDTAWVFDTSMLSPDEVNEIAPGTVVEAGLEQVLIRTYDPATSTATVIRGYNGTTATSHADEALVTLRPKFSRQVVFDAVADEVVSLQPALWGYDTLSTSGSTTPIDIDADTVGLVEVTWTNASNEAFSGSGRILRNYPPSATGRAMVLDVPKGRTAYIVLRKEFPRPTAESDNLADLNVQVDWEQILVVGAASRMSAYVDPTKLDFDWATEIDQHQGNPTGTGTILGRRLQAIRDDLLSAASRRQKREFPPTTTFTNPFRSAAIT